MDGSTGRRRSPVVIGHEAARIVEEVGASVKGLRPGDRVTLESTIYNPGVLLLAAGLHWRDQGFHRLNRRSRPFRPLKSEPGAGPIMSCPRQPSPRPTSETSLQRNDPIASACSGRVFPTPRVTRPLRG